MNWSDGDTGLVPTEVVTVTSTVPVPAGTVTDREVSEETSRFVAAAVPKSTVVAPVNPVPPTSTEYRPSGEPEDGVTEVTVGAPYVNWSEGVTALVPPVVVTVTSTVPVPAGTVAVMSESSFTLKFGDGEDPNFTVLAPVKPEPLMST